MQFRTKLDENMQKELIKVPSVIAFILSVVGLIGFLISVVMSIETESGLYISLLYFFGLLFVMGVVLIFTYRRLIKSFSKINKENEYTIFDEYMEIKTYYHGEVEATCKLYFSDVFKVKETSKYIFVYQNNMRAFPIEKANVPDLEKVRQLLKLK